MNDEYKIRIHMARIETEYGIDVAQLLDDPENPSYMWTEATRKLKKILSYEDPAEIGDIGHIELRNEKIWAYFDYDGYVDMEIPDAIVQRIAKDSR